MGDDEEEKTPAGRYLKRRMDALGFKRKADLADAAGVSRSTITRLFGNADYRPDIHNLRRLATALQVEADELTAGIYGESAAPGPPDLHPLAAELGRMLDPGSPLTDTARSSLADLIDRVMDTSRREMRAGTPVRDAWSPAALHVPAADAPRHRDAPRPDGSFEATVLAGLLNPETAISAADRKALNQLVAAAIQLGETAMMRFDDQLQQAGRPEPARDWEPSRVERA